MDTMYQDGQGGFTGGNKVVSDNSFINLLKNYTDQDYPEGTDVGASFGYVGTKVIGGRKTAFFMVISNGNATSTVVRVSREQVMRADQLSFASVLATGITATNSSPVEIATAGGYDRGGSSLFVGGDGAQVLVAANSTGGGQYSHTNADGTAILTMIHVDERGNSRAGATMAGTFLIAGVMVADDATVVGIANDPLIPVVIAGGLIAAGGVWIYDNVFRTDARSIGELWKDWENNPGNWKKVSEQADPRQPRGGESVREVWRNRETGEEIGVHRKNPPGTRKDGSPRHPHPFPPSPPTPQSGG